MNSFDALLLLEIVLFLTGCHVHLLLLLWSTYAEFRPNGVTIAVGAEGLEFVLGPHFFMQALRPRLVLVVVAYHSNHWCFLRWDFWQVRLVTLSS